MSKAAFEKIKEGLEEAVAVARGLKCPAKVRIYESGGCLFLDGWMNESCGPEPGSGTGG